jgi:glucose/arabinose dehydrogenase
MRLAAFLFAGAAFSLASCGADPSTTNIDDYIGPDPKLVAPSSTAFPTVNVAEAKGWPADKMPTPAQGLAVNEFAGGLDHPRWLLVLPNGDVLVAETDNPGTDKTGGTIRSTIQGMLMKKAGSSHPSANRISLLRDADGDGVAEMKTALVTGLYSPFGMALANGELYVANADGVVAYPFQPGQTRVTARPRHVANLPSGYNHHWTKSMVASPDGKYLYVGVGSNSNVGENGLEMEKLRAAVLRIDAKTGQMALYASGLRNPVGIAWNPWSGVLWVSVNERDEIGNDLVPDYITSVKPGAFYGWPWSYYGQHPDSRPRPKNPAAVAAATPPDYAMGPHVAALGFNFSAGQRLGPRFAQGAFVGEHGSWNRKPWSGYQVVFVPFAGAMPTGQKPVPVLTGFRVGDTAYGRPVGVIIAKDGSLLVADDAGGKVWRVSGAAGAVQAAAR